MEAFSSLEFIRQGDKSKEAKQTHKFFILIDLHLLFARCSAAEVLLVALALGVGEVVAFGGVQGQAQLALEAAQMVLHKVRVCAQ